MANKLLQPVVLCGGGGTRLWPVSRAALSKPFQAFGEGDITLLGETLERIKDPNYFADPVLVCNSDHSFLVSHELEKRNIRPRAIFLEPTGRNTAAAVAVAALDCVKADQDSLLLILPSDHHIANLSAFFDGVRQASNAGAEGWLIAFGVNPTRPETGYGYIKRGKSLPGLENCHSVAKFVEKPSKPKAEAYLDQGDFLWNSGMFLFPVRRLLDEMDRHAPSVISSVGLAIEGAQRDGDFVRIDALSYEAVPNISIDYAVMEKTEYAGVVPVSMGWSDIGSWDAIWQITEKDKAKNASVGDVVVDDTFGSYLRCGRGLLAAVGVHDLVIIVEDDAVLVSSRDRSQDVRRIVDRLADAGRSEHVVHNRVLRPWGSFEACDRGERFQVKRLIINPGASISLQRHRHRSEHWVVVEGRAQVTRDGEIFFLEAGESTFIPVGAIHRLRNPDASPLQIVEVQFGSYLGEDDIERFEDDYGRS